MIDKAIYLRQIDAWSSAQPDGTRLSPAEMEQLAEHLYGNAAQLLVLDRDAKDQAFDELLKAAKWERDYLQGLDYTPMQWVKEAIAAAEEVAG